METIREFIETVLREGAYKIVLSGAAGGEYRRVTLTLSGAEYFAEKLTAKQAFHERIPLPAAAERIEALFAGFSQVNAWNESTEFTARVTKKGKLLSGRHAAASAPKAGAAQREKSYLLSGCGVIPPLVDMGVMTPDGRVKAQMNDKFRQINRFLEFIDELVGDDARELNVIDFGCGKSYLTFIVHYYFTFVKKRPVRMTGVDLKADVIAACTAAAEKYGYDGLRFFCGDIADFAEQDGRPIDLVITLHACDTATDFALYNAVRFGTRYILSVPCCQHELNTNGDFSAMPLFDDGGILRERAAALLTDSIRQKLLTACSYQARVMEFVDLSHTPKNLLIRARKTELPKTRRLDALRDAEDALSLLKTEQTLHRLLRENGYLDIE